ncbi:uncharacterized protein K452DRAFT_286471 [Aplosporella prunicola CBS 121167]|uniref:Secreted protein n=1 Tax=Aplosporella prunicola CBS 121167 TaxID=1176127 RepID=A0A6A6BHN2_9PEZI|nr:uncharacterized protein K452DRAFT_286471 [Aplosporella prunicola CBS 121167]KAF2142845.1 hypothetical protein K452DRAFT_286471 [Aplosporella prunicola CBS 121167]
MGARQGGWLLAAWLDGQAAGYGCCLGGPAPYVESSGPYRTVPPMCIVERTHSWHHHHHKREALWSKNREFISIVPYDR